MISLQTLGFAALIAGGVCSLLLGGMEALTPTTAKKSSGCGLAVVGLVLVGIGIWGVT